VQKRMDRFTLRTKRKVDVQWGLFALVHNIGKIHVFGALILALAERKKTKTAYNERIWSLGGTLNGEGSPKNRFFDSLVW